MVNKRRLDAGITNIAKQSFRKGGPFDPPVQEADMAQLYFENQKMQLKKTKTLKEKAFAFPLSSIGDANK